MKARIVAILIAMWPTLALAVPTGWYSWTNTASPTTDTYSGQWEDSPVGGENASLGDNRIRQLKMNIRLRANAEHCWDATNTTGCPSSPTGADSGRLRAGGARAFSQTTAPTAIGNADANGSTALDFGRLWVDTDGNAIGNLTDNYQLWTYQSVASWQPVLAMGSNGSATNDLRMWDGTSWSLASTSVTTISTGTSSDAVNTAAPTSITDMPMSPGNPSVAIPATGTYLIHVSAQVSLAMGSTNVWVGLVEGDGTTTPVVRECNVQGSSGIAQCVFDYYKDTPTNSLTYTYKLQIIAAASGAFYNAESALALANGIDNKATIQVVRESKNIPKGF